MPKIVILGSCRYEPYKVLLIPNRDLGGRMTPDLYYTNHEKAYEVACEIVYPAIDEADVIIVYAPDGVGEHTQKDIDYAISKGKSVFKLIKMEVEK